MSPLMNLHDNNAQQQRTTKKKKFPFFGKIILVVAAFVCLVQINPFHDPYSPNAKYLMIVAHPDDEILWGGEFLIEHGFETHVVITSGKSWGGKRNQKKRHNEFKTVAAHLQFAVGEYMLGEDKFEYRKELEPHLQRRIRSLICNQKWTQIITHGPDGEYGHPLHHVVYDAVVEAMQVCCLNSNRLYVFQPTKPSPTINTLKQVTEAQIWSQSKIETLKLYSSQQSIIFQSFLGWKEQIVPISQYDIRLGNATCRYIEKFCRLQHYLNAISTNDDDDDDTKIRQSLEKQYHLLYDVDGKKIMDDINKFQNKGISC